MRSRSSECIMIVVKVAGIERLRSGRGSRAVAISQTDGVNDVSSHVFDRCTHSLCCTTCKCMYVGFLPS